MHARSRSFRPSNALGVLVLLIVPAVPAAAAISFDAFDLPAVQSCRLSFAAFDSPVESAIDLAAFDLPAEVEVPAVEPKPRPPRLEVTIYSPTDFYCPPCQRMERECGKGDDHLGVRIEKRPLSAMPPAVQRAGQSVGYPVIEFADGTLLCGARSLADLKRLARERSRGAIPPP